MVFFTCDGCGEALKKNQVEKHKFKCRSSTYSCIDCNAVFTSTSYKDHIKCISEDQKYGGKNFVQKENKGEVKQSQWVEQVERAIRNVREADVKSVLEKIRGFANIPRKETKFINFLLNSIRIRDRNLCGKAWKCIAEEAKRMREEEEKLKCDETTSTQNGEEVEKATVDHSKNNVSKKLVSNGQTDEQVIADGECSDRAKSGFKWKKTIKRTLKEEGGEMKVKKLRKAVIGKYLDDRGEEEDATRLREIFDEKLSSAGVIVDGKLVHGKLAMNVEVSVDNIESSAEVMGEEPLRRSERLKSRERSVSVEGQRSSSVETVTSDGTDSIRTKGTKRCQKRATSASTPVRRSKRLASLEPDKAPEKDVLASVTPSRSPPSRDEKEWSVESGASESSTASASKRRRRTTAVAVEPHIEMIKEEEEVTEAESSAIRNPYLKRSRGPTRENEQSDITPKKRTSRRVSESKATKSSIEGVDRDRTAAVDAVGDGVDQESNSVIGNITNISKGNLNEEASGREVLKKREGRDEQADLREDLCSSHDGFDAHNEKESMPEKVVSSVSSPSCVKGQEAIIIVPSLMEEQLIQDYGIELPSAKSVSRVAEGSNEEKPDASSQECGERCCEIRPQDGSNRKRNESLTNERQPVNILNAIEVVNEAVARRTAMEEEAKESCGTAYAEMPPSPRNTCLVDQTGAKSSPSKLDILTNDARSNIPKAKVKVERSLVHGESPAGTKEVESVEDQLMQAESEEVGEPEAGDRTDGERKELKPEADETAEESEPEADEGEMREQHEADERAKVTAVADERERKQEHDADEMEGRPENEADERTKEREIQADEKATNQEFDEDERGEELEFEVEEEVKKSGFDFYSTAEENEPEADEEEKELQDARCDCEKSAEKTFGIETASFDEEATTKKENNDPVEHLSDTEMSTSVNKKRRKKSKRSFELKASPEKCAKGSKKAKKLSKHSDDVQENFESQFSEIGEERGGEALIRVADISAEDASSDYGMIASRERGVDIEKVESESVLVDEESGKEMPKKKKKTKLVDEGTDGFVGSRDAEKADEDGIGCWPSIDDVTSLWSNRKNDEFLIGDLEAAYSFVANFGESDVNLPNELSLFEIPVPTGKTKRRTDEDVEEIRFEVLAASDRDKDLEVADEEVDKDLFNLKEEDLEDLERELDEMENVEENEPQKGNEEDEASRKQSKKYRKTVVDDRFFSLAEMEEYVEREEKKDTSKGFFDDVEDGENTDDFPVDYRYSDFFDDVEENTSSEDATKKKNKKKKNLAKASEANKKGEDGRPKKKKKSVRFEIDEENDSEDLTNGRTEEGDVEDRPVLMGAVEDERNKETELEKRQKKVRSKIAAIEEANLAPLKWEMGGEVSSFERDENTLLERHIAFDQSAKCAPIITVDSTAKLEALIIQRIKDRVFDDVERKVREPETSSNYRAPIEEPLVKKSLAEVYEEQFQKAQDGETKDAKVDEKIAEIERLTNELFKKLDALSHFRYIPPEIHPEVRIVSNVASLQKEEVGPIASTDDVLMAPEEIKKHANSVIKGKEERDETDRARERRKKKKTQRMKNLEERHREEQNNASDALTEEPKKKRKKRVVERSGVDGGDRSVSANIKSTSFFKQLQQTVASEIKEKTNKTASKKKQRLAKQNASAKYVL